MYVVTGASGRTGHTVARLLLERGHRVRAVTRHVERVAGLAGLGAEPWPADPADPVALAGADAVYAMLAPNYIADSPDFAAYQDATAAALVDAIAGSGVARVVALSSWGADQPDGNGPVAGLHRFERRLACLSAARTTVLRAGYFMENFLGQVEVIERRGVLAAPFRADVALPLINTGDIGAVAAHALLDPGFPAGALELPGPRDVTPLEVTRIIGAAIGRPDLPYVQDDSRRFAAELRRAGVAENVVAMMVEVGEAVNSGHIRTRQPRTDASVTPTTFEQFVAEELLPAFRTSLTSGR